jgi:hypothetical protein
MGEETISKIIAFRKDPNNEKLRRNYLNRIDDFLEEFNECQNDKDAIEIAQFHEKKFRNSLKILISACREKGIPVNEKIISHGRKSSWETVGRFWDAACKVNNVITKSFLSIIKPLLKTKPSIDFYNNVLMETEDFYPLLIQENFDPTIAQKTFARIRELDKINIEPNPDYSPFV